MMKIKMLMWVGIAVILGKKTMAVTLWQLPGNPPSWAVRMLAEILGIPLELKAIDFVHFENKSPEFRKMNPMGTIPVIKDGSLYLPESHSILLYFLEKYGKFEHEQLYPRNLEARAKVDQILYFDAGIAFVSVKNIALPSVFGNLTEITPALAAECDEIYDIVELYLAGNEYIALPYFTIADISLGSTIVALNGLYKLDTTRYPRANAWLQGLVLKPGFRTIAVPGSQSLSAFVNAMWMRNKQANNKQKQIGNEIYITAD